MEKKKWTVFRIATLTVLGAAAILLTLSPVLAWEEVHGRMTGGGSVICNSNPCIESEGGADPTEPLGAGPAPVPVTGRVDAQSADDLRGGVQPE